MIPNRSNSFSRWVSSVLEMPGAPRSISVNVRQPRRMFRTITSVQRSARISDALTIGQYWL